jgi:hypothetical protein
VVAELSCDPTLPFGLGGGRPEPGMCELEPDDAVLLSTDGVVEARTADGELFGLAGWSACWSGQRPACRGTAAAVGMRRAGPPGRGLYDDATLLVQWTGR